MAKKKPETKKPIEQYEHTHEERLNNPPVGLVTAHSDNGGNRKKTYSYDPHLDPQLQWAGKAEHTSFEVNTVSLHVHERIDPRKIIETVKKEDTGPKQGSLFEQFQKPLRQAVEFYKHREGWSNRLVAGDSLLVMNSLLEKEGMAGKVQMVYFDPPYGIKYGSNFQPFVNKRDVKDGKDEDLTAEPEMIKAFRDTWELGIHSYLTYLRDRLLLARELLHESGSVFVQISDENSHRIRLILDEVFGSENFCSFITFRKKLMPMGSDVTEGVSDYIIWFSKNREKIKTLPLFKVKNTEGDFTWSHVELPDRSRRKLTTEEIYNNSLLPRGSKIFTPTSLQPAQYRPNQDFKFEFEGKYYDPPGGVSWKTHLIGMEGLKKQGRLFPSGNSLRYVLFHGDYPVMRYTNLWADTSGVINASYVVQTNNEVIKRCILMTTDPGDLVLDITCGSGTTAFVAEQWGRRWITCDTSRVAITLAKQRLMTAMFDYYELAHASEGVGSGFKYKTVPHITLKSIANNEPAPQETLYDQPLTDKKRCRVTGPFTVEAVPSPVAKSFEEDDANLEGLAADTSISRSGETLRQNEWRDELLRAGVRLKNNKKLEFTRLEPAQGFRYIQCQGETKLELPQINLFDKKSADLFDVPKKVMVVFGPEHAPLEQRTVELAWQEARPFKPDILLFCAFQFDEEAAKDIDELKPEIAGMQLLKVQMNTDLQTEDLKKKSRSNESFWLIGQPDVQLIKLPEGKVQISVRGFDYYDPRTSQVISGGTNEIAMWLLDTDYDGRSLFPSQVFFPMTSSSEGWSKLAKNLKAEIDEEKIEAYRGTVSLPFTPGKAVAVKIIDARGIESLKIIRL